MSNSSEAGPAQQPLPSPEQSTTNDAQNEADSTRSEQAPNAAEAAQIVQQIPAIPLPPISVPGDPQASQPPSTNDVTPTTLPTTTTIVDDGDLIEKEWVDRAIKIVESNRDDPYKQSEELTVVKADYLKKRYDKNIKLK